MSLGRYDEAKAIINQWQQKGSLFAYQKDMLYRIAYIENDTATMDRLDQEAAPDDTGWMQLQSQFAYLRGDIKKFRALSDAEVKIEKRDGQAQEPRPISLARPARIATRKLRLGPSLCRHSVDQDSDSAGELWRCGEAFAEAAISPPRKHWRRNSTAWLPKAPSNRKFICR